MGVKGHPIVRYSTLSGKQQWPQLVDYAAVHFDVVASDVFIGWQVSLHHDAVVARKAPVGAARGLVMLMHAPAILVSINDDDLIGRFGDWARLRGTDNGIHAGDTDTGVVRNHNLGS